MHGSTARIEVHRDEMAKILAVQDAVAERLKSLGFSYVALDLEGYRSGSMDEVYETGKNYHKNTGSKTRDFPMYRSLPCTRVDGRW